MTAFSLICSVTHKVNINAAIDLWKTTWSDSIYSQIE
jgi:hypothetical protein